ncbi:MAG: hypothetical protein ACLUGA_12945 [Oscillospiraceae bacterium]
MGYADGGSLAEGHSYVETIVLLKRGAVNDAEDVPAVAHPILVRKQRSGGLKLRSEAHAALSAEAVLQRRRDRLDVPVVYLPRRERARAATGAGVGNVKDVAQLRRVAGVVHKRDALRAAPDIAAHGVVPHLVACTGRGPRPLSVDHKLVVKRVLV